MKLSFTLTFIAVFLAIQNPFGQANSQIEKACTKYNKIPINGTQTCITILSAIPNCEHSDPKTMALLGMEFAELKVSETVETIKNKLKDDKSLKPRVHGALRKCMALYNEGSYSFDFGLLAFKEENYGSANYRWLSGMQYDVFRCERELNMVGAKGVDLGIKIDFILDVFNSAQAVFHYFLDNQGTVNDIIGE